MDLDYNPIWQPPGYLPQRREEARRGHGAGGRRGLLRLLHRGRGELVAGLRGLRAQRWLSFFRDAVSGLCLGSVLAKLAGRMREGGKLLFGCLMGSCHPYSSWLPY